MASEKRGNLTVENVPQPDEEVLARLTAYQNTRNCFFRGFMPDDGGILIGTRFADSSQVHHVKFPMGARKQLTFLREPVKVCRPAPAGCPAKGFVYGCDKGGDEKMQFYFFDTENGSSAQLTDGKSTNISPAWSEDGKQVVFSSNERDDTHFDVFVVDIEQALAAPANSPRGLPKRTRIMTNTAPGYYRNSFFNGTHLLVEHYVSVTNSTLYLLHAAGATEGDRIQVAPQGDGEEAAVSDGRVWAHGGAAVGVVFASNQGSDFKTLRYYDIASKKTTELVPSTQIPWDVEDIEVCPEYGVLVVAYNIDGCSTLYVMAGGTKGSSPSGKLTELKLGLRQGRAGCCCQSEMRALTMRVVGPAGVLGGMEFSNASGKCTLGLSYICANAPMDAYTLEFKDGAPQELVRWTEAEVGGLNSSTFITPTLIRYKSFDDREISAFVYRPATEEKVPVIVHPHGGPEGQHRPNFSPIIQFLTAQLNVAVIDPNVRGSDGYGKEFVSMDNKEKREDSVKDIGALLDWVSASPESLGRRLPPFRHVATQPGFDSDRIAVWGGSYGGYMVLASMIHFSDRLCCGVDMVGISNFVTFLTNTAGYRRQLRREKYGDESNPEMREWLVSISPLTNAHKIKAPLFIVQGANDPRVPLSEAEQMRDKVRENGNEVWYMVASDEGHGFAKKSNADQYQLAMVAFFKKFLLSN